MIELAAKGPLSFAGMILADFGADVVRVERPGRHPTDPMGRGRRSITVDLKSEQGMDILMRLVDRADVFIEGNRPGVAERLGCGPAKCMARNPRLVYARMTGWGQDGPLAGEAGHDLNFLAAAGGLYHLGEAGAPPPPPLNLVGDFGCGAMFLVFGLMAALIERQTSGCGQIIDAAMVDGIAYTMTAYHSMRSAGMWHDGRGKNLVDGGAPFYCSYRCADGRFVAVGCLEPSTYRAFLTAIDLDAEHWPQHDTGRWADLRNHLDELFATRTRDEWATRFAGTDACVTPVLDLGEAQRHPHLRARGTFVDVAGTVIPDVAPRLSRSPGRLRTDTTPAGGHTDELLTEIGVSSDLRDRLRADGVVA